MMKGQINMMPARWIGLAFALGLPILLIGGCPTDSALYEESLNLIHEITADLASDDGGATSDIATDTPTTPQDPAGESGNTADQEDSEPLPPEEPALDDTPPEQPTQDPGDESNPLEEYAQQVQQWLGGQRLTYLTSNSNGEFYSSHREDHDLCSSGEFQTRIVDQSAGYGDSNETVYESVGTWQILVVGDQLVLEVNTQQDSNGNSGVDQYPIGFGPQGEFYLNGTRYYVTQDNPICD